MKKALLAAAFILTCTLPGISQKNDPLNQDMETKQDFEDAIVSFEQGKAGNAEEYFFGVQAAVVQIDVKLRAIEYLDSIDATPEEF